MRKLKALWMRLRGLFGAEQRELEMAAELESHLQMHIEDNLRSGMSAAQARREAMIKLGGVEQTKQAYRERSTLPFIESFLQDARYAFRQLRKAPGFAVTAILTLAIGIGATTAIFTLVYDVMLKPLPYPQPGQLVVMEEKIAEFKDIYPTLPVNANHFANWQQNAKSFQAMAVMRQDNVPMGAGGHPLQIGVMRVTSGIFSVLDVYPQLGRAFTSAEDQPGHEHVAVLMHDLWRRQFHSDPRILGKSVQLDGYPYTIIGVMPRDFRIPGAQGFGGPSDTSGPTQAEILAPMAFSKDDLQQVAGDQDYFGLARLKPGVIPAHATAEVNALQRRISASLPADVTMTLSAAFTPFQDYLVGSNRKPLYILLAAVAGLLLIGCINITNLMLARAVNRRHEIAIASALGAGRFALVRAAMREAWLLAVLGGTLGVVFATATVPMMQRYLPPALDFRGSLHVDWAGAACALLLACVATLLAGTAPAAMSWRAEPQEALRSESRSASESRRGKRLRNALVAAEAAVSVALVLTTGLLTVSLYKLMNVPRGFDAARTITATINLPKKRYTERIGRAAFYSTMLFKLQQMPGVEHAAIASYVPLTGDRWTDMLVLPGDSRSVFQMPTEHFRWVSPGYFQAIRLPLVAGRYLSADDDGRNVAIVSALAAKTLWPGKDPIGQQFTRNQQDKPFTVIGVVGNARTISLANTDPMMVYVPYWYRCDTTAGLVVRTRQDLSGMATLIRKAVWSVDPSAAVPSVRGLGGIVADSLENRRFEMDLLLLFAVSALLLAGLGVYGVVTYSVVQRKQEMGLRLALGAQQSSIYRLVLRDGLAPVLGGGIAGLVIAFGLERVIGSLLFQVDFFNPALVAGAVALLLAVSVLACLLPARRAAGVDPMQALRAE